MGSVVAVCRVHQLLPDEDVALKPGDRLLVVGDADAERLQQRYLDEPSAVSWVCSGTEPPTGYLFRWSRRQSQKWRESPRRAGKRAVGADVYVTLEPCGHHGRTGPCTEALQAAGVRRVIVGMRDPHPIVNGRGLRRLRKVGIAVVDMTRAFTEDRFALGSAKMGQVALRGIALLLAVARPVGVPIFFTKMAPFKNRTEAGRWFDSCPGIFGRDDDPAAQPCVPSRGRSTTRASTTSSSESTAR